MTSQPPDDRGGRAKAMFREHLGSRYLMFRSGLEQEYDGYAVTKEQEARWRNELIEELADRLSANEVKPLFSLRLMDATEVIPRLLELAPLGDSYAQLEYADALWGMARRCAWEVGPELAERCKKAAIERWQRIAADPPSLSDGRVLPERLSVDGIRAAATGRLDNISEGLDALNPGFNPRNLDVMTRGLLLLFQWTERCWRRLWRRP